MPRPPSAQDVTGTMKSALGARLEGVHALPQNVLLANRDKRGSWGQVNAYYGYCFLCREWLDFATARAHSNCSGRYWDDELAKAEWQVWWQVEQLRENVRSGMHPYHDGVQDRRNHDAVDGSVFPALIVGQRQIVRAPIAKGLSAGLEVMVDIPDSARVAADTADDGDGKPLGVLVYFHGHGGEDCMQAPSSVPGCAVVAVQCPKFVNEGVRCFWFTEGPGSAWTKHQHEQLKRCEVMLSAVASLLDSVLAGLSRLDLAHGVKREVMLLGVSMGGSAVLEFAREFPNRVCSAAVIAGLYNEAQLPILLQATAQIPLLLMHSREDEACPFGTIEKLHRARLSGTVSDGKYPKQVWSRTNSTGAKRVCLDPNASKGGRELDANITEGVAYAETEAWFSDGTQHTASEDDMMAAIRWLQERA